MVLLHSVDIVSCHKTLPNNSKYMRRGTIHDKLVILVNLDVYLYIQASKRLLKETFFGLLCEAGRRAVGGRSALGGRDRGSFLNQSLEQFCQQQFMRKRFLTHWSLANDPQNEVATIGFSIKFIIVARPTNASLRWLLPQLRQYVWSVAFWSNCT